MMVSTPAAARTPQSIPLAETVRVMVEAPTDAEARSVAQELAAAVAREIPLP